MGNETFKKRQKEAARREKREKKIALRIERKRERAGGANQPQGGSTPPIAAGIDSGPEPQNLQKNQSDNAPSLLGLTIGAKID